MAAAILDDAQNGFGDVLVVAPHSARLVRRLVEWSEGWRHGKSATSGFTRLDIGCSTVWITADVPDPRDVPYSAPRRTWVLDAHLLESDPAPDPDVASYCGEMPHRGHWFYRELDGAEIVPADAVWAAYPDQKGEGLRDDDPFYPRLMECRDVVPDLSGGDFVEFAAERLHLRSDKPLTVLSARQRKRAEDQLSQVHRILPFDPNAMQRWYVGRKRELFEGGGKHWIILVKSRRGGMTATEQAQSYRVAVTQPHSQVATLADTMPKTKRIFEMVHLFARKDPKAPRLIGDSKTSLSFENGSQFFIGTAGSDAFSRGEGLSRFHGSEVAFWLRNNMDRTESLWSGIAEAAAHGELTLESTPNGKNWFQEQYQKAKAGDSELKPIFVAWFNDPTNRMPDGAFDPKEILESLDDEERDLTERHALDLNQIAFRRQQKRIHGALFPQEFPEDDSSCFIVGGFLFFDMKTILWLQKHVAATEGRAIPGGHEWVWEEPQKDAQYVLGADASEGVPGGDPNGVGVLRRDTGQQVAAVHGLFRPKVLAEHCKRLSERYNGALMGIERNNHGHAVLLHLEELGYARPHFHGGPLYFFEKLGPKHQTGIASGRTRIGKPGWDTNEQRRQLMLDDLRSWTEENPEAVRDRVFVEELASFRMQDNGKWEHDPGAHDDSIFKWGIARQMLKMRRQVPRIAVA